MTENLADTIPAAALGALLGAVLAAVLVGIPLLLMLRRARAQSAALGAAVSRMGHDLRGALSPALLMAERLEGNADPSIRQAGTIVAQAMDRASALSKDASGLARSAQGGPSRSAKSKQS